MRRSRGVNFRPRQLEALIRIAEASARMHLRSDIREEDVDMAIR